MKTILLSFEHTWFDLIKNGKKKFEYRKHFPEGSVTAYFYVSNPVKAIIGVAEFEQREELSVWLEKYQNNPGIVKRIEDFMKSNRFVMPLKKFQFTTSIPLDKLRKDINNFIVPRMYYYIDDTDLLKYLKMNLIPIGEPIINDFSKLKDDDIC